ncbi:hypothetical protein T12_13871 [Trichinella patagoniensis]|uniref:Uncharacterized protein n=1 Tax=Trichinella patagoniensis TaxID=990121 RepID=A0A0V0Z6N2_9BILA|nr:hypothetical protein T12_11585 [Trichinella patagoniensis]KRY17337.1 hypothetical protein T12_13871 [Trichinella patagoniensis]
MANSNHCYVRSAAQKCNLYAGNPRWLILEETTSAFFDYTEEALAKATLLFHPQPNADSNYSGCIRCRHQCCTGTADQQQLATACLVHSATHRSRTEMLRIRHGASRALLAYPAHSILHSLCRPYLMKKYLLYR